MRVAIAGGGVSGLIFAYRFLTLAKDRHVDVNLDVIEAGPKLGGAMRTDLSDGLLQEWGPHGFLDSEPDTMDFLEELGLGGEVIDASETNKIRKVFLNGGLQDLPMSPPALLCSNVLTWKGKCRLLLEPWIRRSDRDCDESVEAFAIRRLGKEAAANLIDPMVSGIHAGGVGRLSLRSAFPKLARLETEHGSLIKGALAKRKARKGNFSGPSGKLKSLRLGMGQLTEHLGTRLADMGARVLTEAPVTSIDNINGRWQVSLKTGEPQAYDRVVLAMPAVAAAEVLEGMDAELAKVLRQIRSAPIAVGILAFDPKALTPFPKGYGFLVPRAAQKEMLGALWESSIFEERSPEDVFLMRVMIGGDLNPKILDKSDDDILAQILADLRETMGPELGAPMVAKVFRHVRGIPQYTLGHADRLKDIESHLKSHSGLSLIGNAYRGVSFNDCVRDAQAQARSAFAS